MKSKIILSKLKNIDTRIVLRSPSKYYPKNSLLIKLIYGEVCTIIPSPMFFRFFDNVFYHFSRGFNLLIRNHLFIFTRKKQKQKQDLVFSSQYKMCIHKILEQ